MPVISVHDSHKSSDDAEVLRVCDTYMQELG